MRIRELLKKEGIALGVKVDSKDAAIDYLIDLHVKSGNITDKAEFKKKQKYMKKYKIMNMKN